MNANCLHIRTLRQRAAVYGATLSDAGAVGFEVWREQQTYDEMLAVLG